MVHERGQAHSKRDRERKNKGRASASELAEKRRTEKEQSSGKRRVRKGEKLPDQQENVEVEQLRLAGVSLPLEQPITEISSTGGE